MSTVKLILFVALAIITVFYISVWAGEILRRRRKEPVGPTKLGLAIGFVTNFFDTLGIGSFAPTTSIYKLKKLVDDRIIPGTLNVGDTLPTVAQAFIYIAIVEVDMTTLILLIGASVLGAWLGAGIVSKWSRRKVQLGMGLALLAAALLFIIKNLDEMRGTPMIPGGEALSLHGPLLAVGLVGNFVLGALMSLGIGLYAPCLIMISLLGMSPKAAFPIMMGSCAFLMPAGSTRFIREGSYNLRAAISLAIGGIPAVLLAAFIVKSLPLTVVRWGVVVVVAYAAIAMLRSAKKSKQEVDVVPAVPVAAGGD